MSRFIALLLGTLALTLGAVTPAFAGDADPYPPTIGIEVRQSGLTIRGADAAPAGYTRLRFKVIGTSEAYSLAVIELKPGRTRADVDALQLVSLHDPSRVDPIGRIVSGATVRGGDAVVTRVLLRDRRYVVVDVGHEHQRSAGFRPGAGGPGLRPGHHDAAITVGDDGFAGATTLPRLGLIRITNRGDDAHGVVAVRIRAGVRTADALQRYRAGEDPSRLGRRFDLLGPVFAGVVNHVESWLARGRYLLFDGCDRGVSATVTVV